MASVSKGKKHKRKKASKSKLNGEPGKVNGAKSNDEHEIDDAEGEEKGIKTPTEPSSSPQKAEIDLAHVMNNGARTIANDTEDTSTELNSQLGPIEKDDPPASEDSTGLTITDTDARLEALVNERTALREEVARARKSLENIQEKHGEELGSVREQLANTRDEKEQAETQYRNLLGKVNTIRSQLGERLKADAVGIRLALPFHRSWCYRKTYRRREVE